LEAENRYIRWAFNATGTLSGGGASGFLNLYCYGLSDADAIGPIDTYAANNAGSGYVAGEVLTVTGGTGAGATIVVLSVDGGGAVTGFEFWGFGRGYQPGVDIATTTTGAGVNFTFDILSIISNPVKIGNAGTILLLPTCINQSARIVPGGAEFIQLCYQGPSTYLVHDASRVQLLFVRDAPVGMPGWGNYPPAEVANNYLIGQRWDGNDWSTWVAMLRLDADTGQVRLEDKKDLFTARYIGQVAPYVAAPADTDVWDGSNLVFLGSGIDITGFTPKFIGQRVTLHCTDSTADATVTCGTATFNGTNTVATFGAAGDTLELIAISMTRWLILVNIGPVTFS